MTHEIDVTKIKHFGDIGEYTLGKVVYHNLLCIYGHIIGFDEDFKNQVILRIRWANGEEFSENPFYITLL